MHHQNPGHPLLDEGTVQTLKAIPGDGGDVFTELVGLFIENATERVESIQKALQRQDLEELMEQTQALKSSSANIGALLFSETCRTLEANALEENLASIQSTIAGFYQEFTETCQALDRAAR